jgi:hypothetical protein
MMLPTDHEEDEDEDEQDDNEDGLSQLQVPVVVQNEAKSTVPVVASTTTPSHNVVWNRFATAEQRRRREQYDMAQQKLSSRELIPAALVQPPPQQATTTKAVQQQQQRKLRLRPPQAAAASRILQKGFQSTKQFVQRVNVARWIDDLEHDQEIANELDQINCDTMEETQRKALVAQVHASCMNAIQEHLTSFVQEHPYGTYEEWIAELHPENVVVIIPTTTTTTNGYGTTASANETIHHSNTSNDNSNSNDSGRSKIQIDSRFYVADSDHLRLWQKHSKNDTFRRTNTSACSRPPEL